MNENTTENSQDDQKPRMNFSKLLIVILSILILFALVVAGYFYIERNKLQEDIDSLTDQVNTLTIQLKEAESNLEEQDTEEEVDDPVEDPIDEDEETEERILYKYTHDGMEYTLYLENPNDLSYSVENEVDPQGKLIIKLDSDATLSIIYKDDEPAAGVYGEYVTTVRDDIIRNRFDAGFGSSDFYLIKADPSACEYATTDENPCIYFAFHMGDEGKLEAYLSYTEIPVSSVFEVADSLIRSYEVE